jgi:hypothetical protein
MTLGLRADVVRLVGQADAPRAGLGDERWRALAQHLAGEQRDRVDVEHDAGVPAADRSYLDRLVLAAVQWRSSG